jgi:DNA polymerase-3 subunit epsilon
VRDRLEKRSDELGVRVMGNVSRLTVLLVTDGSYVGIKREKAAECGTRVVEPAVYEHLLKHLQPATTTAVGPLVPSHATPPPKSSTGSTPRRVTDTGPEASQPSPGEVRTWALANGHPVGVRGRLPRDVIEAYAEAHSVLA